MSNARCRLWWTLGRVLLGLPGLGVVLCDTRADTLTVTNNAPITTQGGGPASPYPSSVNLSGAPGTITAVRVTLHNISHTSPVDYDILLVGPGGQSVVLMSDCGGHEVLRDVTITFSDITRLMPDFSEIESGTYRPTNYSWFGPTTPFGPLDEFPPDEPRTYPSSLSLFTNTSPNGTWNLYVVDDDSFYPDGTIAGGWTLEVDTTAFRSTGPIVIPDAGAANPYPSLITAAGFPGNTKKVRITLNGLSHTFPDDLDIMVVGPGGQNAIILSDVGGDSDLANVTLTLDDEAPNSLPDESQVVGGAYKPTNFGGSDTFPVPGPAPAGTSTLSVFNDTNPNGTWGLYVVDDHGQEMGGMDHWTVDCDPKPPVLANISTRLNVGTGDKVLIGGFIVSGTQPKKVILRAIGPSIGIPGNLENPTLELRDGTGGLIRFNDNWRADQEAEIVATGIPPGHDLESAIVATLPANNAAYTVIVRGANESTGIGLVEVYDLDRTVNSKLANISTRGFVDGDNVLIAGTIILGGLPQTLCVRGLGPSLPLPGALGNPYIAVRDANGALIIGIDDWKNYLESEIVEAGLAPADFYEAASIRTLPSAGAIYTVILEGGQFNTGIALVEIYALN